MLAPYVDMGLWPTADLAAMSAATGVTTFTTAFVLAESGRPCTPAWGGYPAYEIGTGGDFMPVLDSFRAGGGSVVVSFGGASGSELADACTSDPSLLAAYKAVVDRFGVSRIDFDIEGASVANATANQRRARVLAQLQADYADAGKPLQIQVTLPVTPDGLDSNGRRTLAELASAGVDLAYVNVMAMDYGAGYPRMGEHAITAAQGTAAQMREIPTYASLSDAQRLAMVGITPMIGQNDVPDEVFTLQDATDVATWAKANGVGLIGWWEMTRDRPCTTPTEALYLCTRLPDPQWAFSRAFVAATGGQPERAEPEP